MLQIGLKAEVTMLFEPSTEKTITGWLTLNFFRRWMEDRKLSDAKVTSTISPIKKQAKIISCCWWEKNWKTHLRRSATQGHLRLCPNSQLSSKYLCKGTPLRIIKFLVILRGVFKWISYFDLPTKFAIQFHACLRFVNLSLEIDRNFIYEICIYETATKLLEIPEHVFLLINFNCIPNWECE